MYPFFRANDKLLLDYLQCLLNDPENRYSRVIYWQNKREGIFKIVDTTLLAQYWGIRKNCPTMNYDKLSRSLRYYYKSGKLKKVPGQRQVYQFIFSNKNPPHVTFESVKSKDGLNKCDDCNLPKILTQHSVKQENIVIKEEELIIAE